MGATDRRECLRQIRREGELLTVIGIIISIVGLGLLILVHELGHFIVAKSTGMRVEEFSLGFGRYLWSRRVGETVYGVSVLPIGGYVRVTGMHEEEFAARVAEGQRRSLDPEARLTGQPIISAEEIAETPLNRRYYAKPVWQRIVFIVAGVSMNVVAAFVLLFIVGLQGYQVPTTQIQTVQAGTPAQSAGLKPGDTIVSIDGKPTSSWDEVHAAIVASPGKTVPIVVQRQGTTVTVPATVGSQTDKTGFLGIAPAVETVHPGPVAAVGFAWTRTGEMFTLFFRGIGMMVHGTAPVLGPQGLAGPVGIVTLSSQAVRGGYFLSLLAFISVQLALINMLPLLPLDGGHVLFNIIEKVMGRPISLRTFESISMVGLALFLVLALVATSNDIGRLLHGGAG
jgi:regulator of sigma E protease